MSYQEIRQQIIETVQKGVRNGLIRLSAGNISARAGDGCFAITPSGIPYDVLKAEEIAIVDLDGRRIDGPRKPSSETPMHCAIYRHLPEVQAIFHTHSPFAMTFATLNRDIPVVCIELYRCGAPIPVAPWACPGTAQAGDVTVDIFSRRPALKVCLLRNHGLVAIGKNLNNAFELAFDAEVGMQIYHQAKLVGYPETITPDELAQIKAVYA